MKRNILGPLIRIEKQFSFTNRRYSNNTTLCNAEEVIPPRSPDLVKINKKKKRTCIVDFAVLADHRVTPHQKKKKRKKETTT